MTGVPSRQDPEDESALLDSQGRFALAVAPLARGSLLFPPPFDLVASSALCANDEAGAQALANYLCGTRNAGRRFQIQVHELPPDDQPELPSREVVDCVIDGPGPAAALLIGLAGELTADPES